MKPLWFAVVLSGCYGGSGAGGATTGTGSAEASSGGVAGSEGGEESEASATAESGMDGTVEATGDPPPATDGDPTEGGGRECELPVELDQPGSSEWFVAPDGAPAGDGSPSSPWDLQTALDHPEAVSPGDRIRMKGGVYEGVFTSQLMGSEDAPIIVLPVQGEIATIDTLLIAGAGISAQGSDVWFVGFEIMSSDLKRQTEIAGSWPEDLTRASGVIAQGPRHRFINLHVHDVGQGFSLWSDAPDTELYGALIYHNGWHGPDRGHGHGVYSQNETGLKILEDNIQFNGFGMGIRSYGSGEAFIKGFRYIGNTSFNSGVLEEPAGRVDNVYLEGGHGCEDIQVVENMAYHDPEQSDGYSRLGAHWSVEEKDLIARGNYFIGGESPMEVWHWNEAVVEDNVTYNVEGFATMQVNLLAHQSLDNYAVDGNTYYGRDRFRHNTQSMTFAEWQAAGLDSNGEYIPGAPTGVWTFVRPNRYECGRANITIYNWDLEPAVEVDLSEVLAEGDAFEIFDAQNFAGGPVVSDTVNGEPILIPMEGLELVPPIGNIPHAPPPHTAPQFGVFVVRLAGA